MTSNVPQDFEDILELLEKHKAKYLIIGGLAFTYHVKPRYTKDMDLWIDPSRENITRTNQALQEFGSPFLLGMDRPEEILQLGVAPNRIDILKKVKGARFETAWKRRIRAPFGKVQANWVDIDTLIRIKSRLEGPRHQEDLRLLREVKRRKR
ncbi:MAG: hypothetical protein JRJ13_05850 [Deltaproteobacteria bacterium]|nr:hypothetical protein [Deltaproteobacteria bacterium]RLB14247.1 MAG: hypothetical protein DRG63_08800 [Deltaproteobacteria bacterium]